MSGTKNRESFSITKAHEIVQAKKANSLPPILNQHIYHNRPRSEAACRPEIGIALEEGQH